MSSVWGQVRALGFHIGPDTIEHDHLLRKYIDLANVSIDDAIRSQIQMLTRFGRSCFTSADLAQSYQRASIDKELSSGSSAAIEMTNGFELERLSTLLGLVSASVTGDFDEDTTVQQLIEARGFCAFCARVAVREAKSFEFDISEDPR